MNPKKNSPPLRGSLLPFRGQAGSARQFKPVVAQLKIAVPAQTIKHPVVPPVYRPQPLPKVLQTKKAIGQNPQAHLVPGPPVAPPVYRPQARPLIAQPKIARNSQIRKHPVAPPVYRPPAKPGPTNATVQRYTDVKIAQLDGDGRLSQNGNYFIPKKPGQIIYADTQAAVPQSSVRYGLVKRWNERRYQGYISDPFLQDCLHTAEEIIHRVRQGNPRLEFKPARVVRSRVVTGEDFGGRDEDNVSLATTRAVNDAAAPGLGQAYVIVNKNWPQGVEYPYHAAAVVAIDGTDRVTLEVFAGGRDAKNRNVQGTYRMYSTGDVGEKFHSYWKGQKFGDDSGTLVIEPK